MCAHCFLRKRLRATFGSMQAVSPISFFKSAKNLVNTDFFGCLPFQKNTDKMF